MSVDARQRAVRVHAHRPDGLVVAETTFPGLGPRDVRIAVAAAGLNFPDVLMADGSYQNTPAVPFTLGMECAGVVTAAGDAVDEVAVGDHVLALVPHGAFAEGLVADASRVFRVPRTMPFADAAAFGLAYGTAFLGLVRRGRLWAGETVLVTGATGGVGVAAVQVAKLRGATVIAAARRLDDAKALLGTAADAYVRADPATLRDDVMAATGGRGADVVFDVVGGDLFAQALRCVAWEGRAVIVGFAGGAQSPVKPGHLLVKNIAVAGLQLTDYLTKTPELVRSAMQEGLEAYAADRLTVPVTATFPLEDAATALAAVRSGDIAGKAVLVIARGDGERTRNA